MKVSIVIINYNTFEITCNCIRSVIKYTTGIEYEIILVDNASIECLPELFLKEFPQIKLIKNIKNEGFAKGNNTGILSSIGKYVLLLNSDTILRENSIGKSVKELESNSQIGILGCRTVFPDGGVQFTARRFRSIQWELLDLFRFILFLMSYKKRASLMLGKYFRHNETKECDWVNGAFFIFPKRILEDLPSGKLDDRFFMYGEDQLWCEKFKKLGYTILFYSGTTIVHICSGSTIPSKRFQLRKIMIKHELEIMLLRKGKGFYYYCFLVIYLPKEIIRNYIYLIYFRIKDRLIR